MYPYEEHKNTLDNWCLLLETMQVHNFVGGQCGFTLLLEDDYAKSDKADKKKSTSGMNS